MPQVPGMRGPVVNLSGLLGQILRDQIGKNPEVPPLDVLMTEARGESPNFEFGQELSMLQQQAPYEHDPSGFGRELELLQSAAPFESGAKPGFAMNMGMPEITGREGFQLDFGQPQISRQPHFQMIPGELSIQRQPPVPPGLEAILSRLAGIGR